MLNIRIIDVSGSAPNYSLVLTDNGHSIAHGNEDVQWIVMPQAENNGLKYIKAITWKNISGSTNPFPAGFPQPRNPQKKIWFGKVDNVGSESVYVYTIKWVHRDGTEYDFDPIISIKPSKFLPEWLISLLVNLLGLLALSYFIHWRMKRMEKRLKKNE